jgi:2-oxoglutarate ferredoxin oxidoreductase subunit alpha
VPAVVVDVMRGGPGLGNIAPSQGDYFQMVKSAGHGDFRPIVLAPATVQEAIDLTTLAFELAERYRTIVTVLLDGTLGQMMEPAELPAPYAKPWDVPEWALSGAAGRSKRLIASIQLQPEALEAANRRLQAKITTIAENEVRTVEYLLDDAEFVVVSFGSAGRIAQSAVATARQQGIRAGLLRPITLFPFPSERVAGLAARGRGLLVVEMNAGQMLDDVKIAAAGLAPVRFYGHMGGVVPFPDEILEAIVRLDQETPRTLPFPNVEWLLNHLPQRAGNRG